MNSSFGDGKLGICLGSAHHFSSCPSRGIELICFSMGSNVTPSFSSIRKALFRLSLTKAARRCSVPRTGCSRFFATIPALVARHHRLGSVFGSEKALMTSNTFDGETFNLSSKLSALLSARRQARRIANPPNDRWWWTVYCSQGAYQLGNLTHYVCTMETLRKSTHQVASVIGHTSVRAAQPMPTKPPRLDG